MLIKFFQQKSVFQQDKIVFQERWGRSSALPGAALGRYFFQGVAQHYCDLSGEKIFEPSYSFRVEKVSCDFRNNNYFKKLNNICHSKGNFKGYHVMQKQTIFKEK